MAGPRISSAKSLVELPGQAIITSQPRLQIRPILLDEILRRDQPLARLEMIRRVSRRFGHDHLIRVRQFVNRHVFPAAASGDLDGVLRLSLRRAAEQNSIGVLGGV